MLPVSAVLNRMLDVRRILSTVAPVEIDFRFARLHNDTSALNGQEFSSDFKACGSFQKPPAANVTS